MQQALFPSSRPLHLWPLHRLAVSVFAKEDKCRELDDSWSRKKLKPHKPHFPALAISKWLHLETPFDALGLCPVASKTMRLSRQQICQKYLSVAKFKSKPLGILCCWNRSPMYFDYICLNSGHIVATCKKCCEFHHDLTIALWFKPCKKPEIKGNVHQFFSIVQISYFS